MLDTPKTIVTRIRRSAFAFPLVALAGLAMLLISETSYWRASDAMDRLGSLGEARTSIQQLHRYMLDAETGQRGYLLTGRKNYLTPYREANEEINVTLQRLRDYYGTLPQAPQMKQLDTLVQRKMSEMHTSVQLYDQGREDAWRALLDTDIGKEQMDQIRALSAQLLAEETRKVGVGRKDVYDTLLLNRIGIGAMIALSLLALFMYLRQTDALEKQREEQAEAIQAERDHLESEVKRRTQQLIQLAQHLQSAREDERSRLARELHDELGALLTAAKLDAARLKSRIAAVAPEALERLAHLSDTLNSGIALKRRIIEDLRPSALSNLGLVAALDILARETAERMAIPIHASLEPVALTPAAELTAYRLVQEALTNVSKYAKAKAVQVTLAPAGDAVSIAVADDGIGFHPDEANTGSHGLFGMRYRVEAVGGTLTIDSGPGRGTRIEARLPASAVASPAAGVPEAAAAA